eukprot:7163268-Prymnesium_polylepis.1
MGMRDAFAQGVFQRTVTGPVSWLSRSAPDREIPGSILRGRERIVCLGEGGTAWHGTARHGLG